MLFTIWFRQIVKQRFSVTTNKLLTFNLASLARMPCLRQHFGAKDACLSHFVLQQFLHSVLLSPSPLSSRLPVALPAPLFRPGQLRFGNIDFSRPFSFGWWIEFWVFLIHPPKMASSPQTVLSLLNTLYASGFAIASPSTPLLKGTEDFELNEFHSKQI